MFDLPCLWNGSCTDVCRPASLSISLAYLHSPFAAITSFVGGAPSFVVIATRLFTAGASVKNCLTIAAIFWRHPLTATR
jgi:hypothetical protein